MLGPNMRITVPVGPSMQSSMYGNRQKETGQGHGKTASVLMQRFGKILVAASCAVIIAEGRCRFARRLSDGPYFSWASLLAASALSLQRSCRLPGI